MKLMRSGGFEHVQMHRGIFVASETDVANFSGFFRFEDGFHPAAGSEDTPRVGHSNDFVELEKIDVIGLEAAERFIDLRGRGLPGLAVDLGHEEGFQAVAVAERLTHADLAVTAIVVPAVVEEIDATVEGRADDFDALLFVGLHADVIAAETDEGNALAGTAELAIGNAVLSAGGQKVTAGNAGQE